MDFEVGQVLSGTSGRTVGAVWREVQARLEAGREVGPREGRMLVQQVLGLDEVGLVMAEGAVFREDKRLTLEGLVARRLAGEPLAHVLGYAWFYGRRWMVTPEVLIPRPDTEVLVEAVLARLKEGDRVAEVGVGSGCILGTLLAERDGIVGFGVDISGAAVEVARANIARQGVAPARFEVRVNDGLEGVQDSFNLLVSNPPYVTDGEWEKLDGEVKDCEPRLALTGGVANPDGLVFYRRLAGWGERFLRRDGWLCVEVGWQQGQAVRDLLHHQRDDEDLVWREISGLKDLGGRERVVCAQRC